MNAGKRLQKLAKEEGISQSELARGLGISAQYISVLAAGKNEISLTLATLVECKYGIRAEWLISGEGEKYTDKTIAGKEKNELICRILLMNDEEICATLAYVHSIEFLKNK